MNQGNVLYVACEPGRLDFAGRVNVIREVIALIIAVMLVRIVRIICDACVESTKLNCEDSMHCSDNDVKMGGEKSE